MSQMLSHNRKPTGPELQQDEMWNFPLTAQNQEGTLNMELEHQVLILTLTGLVKLDKLS